MRTLIDAGQTPEATVNKHALFFTDKASAAEIHHLLKRQRSTDASSWRPETPFDSKPAPLSETLFTSACDGNFAA